MSNRDLMAVEILKTQATMPPTEGVLGAHLGGVLRRFVDDKGYDHRAVYEIARRGNFGLLVRDYVMRRATSRPRLMSTLNYYAEAIGATSPLRLERYTGDSKQNLRIDQAIGNSNPDVSGFRQGIATNFQVQETVSSETAGVPIGVIGFGAAGILVRFALQVVGFHNVTVYEKQKTPLGIWGRKNVYARSRNNPATIRFHGFTLDKAPGSGQEVKRFLERVDVATAAASVYGSRSRLVKEIRPGNLRHRVEFEDGESRELPILINATGLGKPLPLSDPNRMTTGETTVSSGFRWQQELDLETVDGKRLVFIGLGNSTAEMLRQVHELQDKGQKIDYRVITHYPKDAVFNPNDTVEQGGKQYQVFRDTSKNLVDYQGDLPLSRYDYYRALHGGKICYGISRWKIEDRHILTYDRYLEGDVIKYDQLYTLIGYGRQRKELEQYGCTPDESGTCALYDYDGEMIQTPSATVRQGRLYKGYFGFGAVLDAPWNPNAIVIPGMVFRLGDLLFSVIMRAEEYIQKKR